MSMGAGGNVYEFLGVNGKYGGDWVRMCTLLFVRIQTFLSFVLSIIVPMLRVLMYFVFVCQDSHRF